MIAPDVLVIGAGSAGFSAAISAAERGANVLLVGHGAIGGTCVNVGCVPSKALIRTAESVAHARAAHRFAGVTVAGKITDWRATVAQKDELVAALQGAKYRDVLAQYDSIHYLEGRARFTSAGVEVDGQIVDAPHTIVATGASPATPAIPGIDRIDVLTSTSALAMSELPKSLLIIGGGAIGCELGQLFARAGVAVTIVCRTRLLASGEPEISDALALYLRAEGISVKTGVTYERIRSLENGSELVVRDADGCLMPLHAERVLVATGRTPNTAHLDLARAGIAQIPNGGIAVDDRMRTTRARTYAVGDVTGKDMYVYMAAYGGKIAIEHALGPGDGRRYDASAMPEVTFTDPQVATVGMTEARARAAGLDVDTVVLPLDAVPRALAARDTRGLIKLVADRETGRLLGAHVLAPEGGDTIQTAVLAIKGGLTVTDLAETIFPYLTTVEGLKLAALAFSKDVARLSCCAG